MKKTTMTERLSKRIGQALRRPRKSPVVRALGSRGAATVLIGTALSIGGLSESFSNVHFLVEKKLDTVEVVRHEGESRTLIASLGDGFAAHTVFKLSRVLPDRYVTRQLSLFDENSWIPELTGVVPEMVQEAGGVFHSEMSRINDAIRREFFETSLETVRRDYFVKSMPYGDLIHRKAEKYGVDPALVAAVIEQESRFKSRARSHVGARGLMQLMPRTGSWMGARDLYDPEQNVDAGVKYLKYLEKRFNGNRTLILAAYNGGEGNVQRYGGIPPFRETRTYVKKVMQNYDRRSRELRKFEQNSLHEAVAAAPGAEAAARR
ncbi:MAG TPA: lytic transglycosylase domain-containing protein [Thermoanaerobaculia bacterium]|nr:lytic transglycosylase domain-containing protein [Thermoanaerobaculia bacterium]